MTTPPPFLSRFNWLRIGVHLFGLSTLLQLLVLAALGNLTVNPIQFMVQMLGQGALNLLMASLAVTPLVTLTGWRALIPHRRTLGLYAFMYATLHFTMFAGVDYAFDMDEINRQIVEKPNILMGVTAGIILLALALTSTKASMRAMGKGWQSLHRGIYIAGVIVVIHYAWATKGTLTQLSGDIARPLAFGALLALLLVLRVPPVRRWASALRQRRK